MPKIKVGFNFLQVSAVYCCCGGQVLGTVRRMVVTHVLFEDKIHTADYALPVSRMSASHAGFKTYTGRLE